MESQKIFIERWYEHIDIEPIPSVLRSSRRGLVRLQIGRQKDKFDKFYGWPLSIELSHADLSLSFKLYYLIEKNVMERTICWRSAFVDELELTPYYDIPVYWKKVNNDISKKSFAFFAFSTKSRCHLVFLSFYIEARIKNCHYISRWSWEWEFTKWKHRHWTYTIRSPIFPRASNLFINWLTKRQSFADLVFFVAFWNEKVSATFSQQLILQLKIDN